MGLPAVKLRMSKDQKSRRDALVEKYRGFAENCAAHLIKKFGLPGEMLDELVSASYLGLVEASTRYDPDKQHDFKSFAYLRLKGAMIDAIRDTSDLSTEAYRYLKALEAAEDLKEYELHEARTHPETKPDAVYKLAKLFNFASKGALAFRLAYEEREEEVVDSHGEIRNPEEELHHRRTLRLLRELMTELPEDERKILEDYYIHDRSFIEITSDSRNLSKSWVSRLHARGIERLHKAYLKKVRCGKK